MGCPVADLGRHVEDAIDELVAELLDAVFAFGDLVFRLIVEKHFSEVDFHNVCLYDLV